MKDLCVVSIMEGKTNFRWLDLTDYDLAYFTTDLRQIDAETQFCCVQPYCDNWQQLFVERSAYLRCFIFYRRVI